MRILFLDQSGQLGGAELSLMDIAQCYRHHCLVGLLQDGPFRHQLEAREIPVQVLAKQSLPVHQHSHWRQSLKSVKLLIPLVNRVIKLSHHYDVIYANTQKALVVGAIASFLTRRPLIYHLRDIASCEHFSATNRRILVYLANHQANRVIANSYATRDAFIAAGGYDHLTTVIYNGFNPSEFTDLQKTSLSIRKQLGWPDRWIIGHFSRLSPWKGQHILIEALQYCPEQMVAVFVGDALFGEQAYVQQLHAQVSRLGLQHRVKFLGFQQQVPPIMAACDIMTHTSVSPEPFGRVIVEAMLCGTPVIGTAIGGVPELITHGETGWLTPANNPKKLAETLCYSFKDHQHSEKIAQQAKSYAIQKFHLDKTNQAICNLLQQCIVPSHSDPISDDLSLESASFRVRNF